MNAPFAAICAREGATRRVPLARWLSESGDDWHAIAGRPSEPNSFADPWFVGASLRHLPLPDHAAMLEVRDAGQLIGLMPVFAAPRYGRMPVRHVENWQHYNVFYGAPLVRRAFEPFFWGRMLELLDRDGASPFLHVAGLDPAGPLCRALLGSRPGAAIVHRTRRALLRSDLSPPDYYAATVRKKKRKEIARLRARLDECGTVRFGHFDESDDLDTWIADFLTLEASGWKGSDGAALANRPETEAFLRDALHGAARAGCLQIVRLDLDARPLAMLINFLCPPGSYSFKIAFDEAYARFSPGVLLQIENLNILDRVDIDWMDSCAVEGHPMIESLWGERREIVRVTVPLKGWRNRAVFTACRALETASARLRRAA